MGNLSPYEESVSIVISSYLGDARQAGGPHTNVQNTKAENL